PVVGMVVFTERTRKSALRFEISFLKGLKRVRGSDESFYFLYSRISPGSHSRALQIASRVERRIALARLFLRMDILAIVIPTFSDSSVTLIFLLASITSMLMMIGMVI